MVRTNITLPEKMIRELAPGSSLTISFANKRPDIVTLSYKLIEKLIKGDELTVTSSGNEYHIFLAADGSAQDKILFIATSEDQATLLEEMEIVLEESTSSNESARRHMTEASSRAYSIISELLPTWFLDTFGESLVDDLFNIAKEEGGKIWWLKLLIVASQFVIKFAWRRFGRRKAAEKAGSLPKGRGDDEL